MLFDCTMGVNYFIKIAVINLPRKPVRSPYYVWLKERTNQFI